MSKIKILLPPCDDSYTVSISNDFVEKPLDYLSKVHPCRKFALITDSEVTKFCGNKLYKQIKQKSDKAEMFVIPAGEKSKNWAQVSEVARAMIRSGFDRGTLILALGGGVVGDIAGFVARVFMRGVPYVQIPTSLLAMVDSAIGGKVGVDAPEGKNLLGAFYQPKHVFMYLPFLKSLPERQFHIGLAEVVKYGIIWDEAFFQYLEKHMDRILERNQKTTKKIIKRSVEIKGEVVSKDEKEGDLRKILNFGHTLGHALETLSGFSLSHGEAISIGMHFACFLGEKRGFKDKKRVVDLLQLIGLPVAIPKQFSPKKLIQLMKKDKKSVSGKILFILPKKIGQVYDEIISDRELEKAVNDLKK